MFAPLLILTIAIIVNDAKRDPNLKRLDLWQVTTGHRAAPGKMVGAKVVPVKEVVLGLVYRARQ